jgi:pyruvate,water dikinase
VRKDSALGLKALPASNAKANRASANTACRHETVTALPHESRGVPFAQALCHDATKRPSTRRHGGEALVERLATQLLRITRPFMPRPVIYRSYDFRSNELRGLLDWIERPHPAHARGRPGLQLVR